MSARIRVFVIMFALVLAAAPVLRVHAQDATPTPDIHAQHHAAAGTSATPNDGAPVGSDVAGHLLHMQGMLGELAGMDLPDEAIPQIEELLEGQVQGRGLEYQVGVAVGRPLMLSLSRGWRCCPEF